jgi:hypothetical protein
MAARTGSRPCPGERLGGAVERDAHADATIHRAGTLDGCQVKGTEMGGDGRAGGRRLVETGREGGGAVQSRVQSTGRGGGSKKVEDGRDG